jgi:hypothetical protein
MYKNFIIIIAASFLVTSCSKKENNSVVTNTYTRKVVLYEADGTVASNQAGVNVTIEKNGVTKTTTTNNTGDYTFPNLEIGQYNVTYSGTNVSTVKAKFDNTTVPSNIPNFSISKVPDFTIASFTPSVTQAGYYNFLGSSNVAAKRYITVFCSKNNNVSKDNNIYEFTFASNSSGAFPTPDYGNNNLTNKGFLVGETIYVIAYPSALYVNKYIDPVTNALVYPALGTPSAVKSFVLQ